MLVAEIHGKKLTEAHDHEDYLTSTVFGNLRYLQPRFFWEALFDRTKSSTPDESPLTAAVDLSVSDYDSVDSFFWPYSAEFGEPDLILRFSGDGLASLVLIVEVKLRSGKSGSDEHDQLARYLRLLDDLPSANVPVTEDDSRYLIYLTPRDSLAEIDESLSTLVDSANARNRIYRLQWQDVVEVAKCESRLCDEPATTILDDIAEFLCRRGLQYFDGFRTDIAVDIRADDGGFYDSDSLQTMGFTGFEPVESFEVFPIQKGGWAE